MTICEKWVDIRQWKYGCIFHRWKCIDVIVLNPVDLDEALINIIIIAINREKPNITIFCPIVELFFFCLYHKKVGRHLKKFRDWRNKEIQFAIRSSDWQRQRGREFFFFLFLFWTQEFHCALHCGAGKRIKILLHINQVLA